MANLTAEQYDILQEMLKVITEARQISERLSESWAKGLANPIGPHTTHLSSLITPMTPSQSPQSQIFMIECEDDKEEAHQIQETVMIPDKTADSVSDVLLVHRMDSQVKEVEESSQKSTSGSGKEIAHQLFDKMPLAVTSKEKQRKSLKAWKFKFKISFKRSKLMDDMFSFVEETAWLNRDPKETIWDFVKKECKETMAACGKKTIDRLKLVDETSKPAVYDRPFQIRVWDSGGSSFERVDEESSGDDKSSEVIATETIVKLMHKALMDSKYSFVDESSGKDVKVLEAQQGFKTQVCSNFDVKAFGLEIYSWEYKKQRKLEKSPFQHTYAAQIKRCGETTRQIDFFTGQMLKIRVLVKQMLVKENDIYLDNVEASEFFSPAHGSDMAPQREIKSQQASEDLLESPLLQEEKSIDSTKQIIIWIIFKELCSAGFERENETIKKSFKGLSKVEKDHKIEATVLVFLKHIFGIEIKVKSGWIKYQEQGAKYEWSLFLQALHAVKDHKNTNYVTNTAILGVKRKYDPHGRLKEDMSLGSLTQKHHNKWGILTGTEIFSYNGVIIQVMVQRQWETFVMMLLSIAESLILLSDPFIFAEKKGIEISISCCYGTSSVDMQFSTAFEIMSKQLLLFHLEREQNQVIKLISSWKNRIWEPGGVLIERDKWKGLEKCYERGRLMRLMHWMSSMWWKETKFKEIDRLDVCGTRMWLVICSCEKIQKLLLCYHRLKVQEMQIFPEDKVSIISMRKGLVCDKEKKKLRNARVDGCVYVLDRVNSLGEEEFVGFIEFGKLQLAMEFFLNPRLFHDKGISVFLVLRVALALLVVFEHNKAIRTRYKKAEIVDTRKINFIGEFAVSIILAVIGEHEDMERTCVLLKISLNGGTHTLSHLVKDYDNGRRITWFKLTLNSVSQQTTGSAPQYYEVQRETNWNDVRQTEATWGAKLTSPGYVENSLAEFCAYEVYHPPRPPELSRYKEDEESTAIGSISAIVGENKVKAQKFSSLRTRMFSTGEYCYRMINITRFTYGLIYVFIKDWYNYGLQLVQLSM